jgi:HSP20 family protein
MAKKAETTPMQQQAVVNPSDWMEEFEGQLAVDIYQTPSDIVIKAPIAGVRPQDLDVTITDDTVTIRGERRDEALDQIEGYMVQECYWGSFSRMYQLPIAVDSDKAIAKLANGILTISIPKAAKARTKSIAVQLD